MFTMLAGFECTRQGKSRASQSSKTEAFTKLVLSAKSGLGLFQFRFPGTAVPASDAAATQLEQSLSHRHGVPSSFVTPSNRETWAPSTTGGASELSCGCRVGTEQTAALLKDDPAGKAGLLKPEIHSWAAGKGVLAPGQPMQ